jgi:CheY-like chemotaxis protein
MAEKRRMLLIDDIQMIIDLFIGDFEDEFEILVAQTGIEGIETAARSRPDVILLDINLPDISGVEVAKRLSQRPETERIPVVAISACEFNAYTRQLLKQSPNVREFLSKMDSSDTIRECVHRAMTN